MPTYKSLVPITNAARKLEAYARARMLFDHAPTLGFDVLRVQYMVGTQFIEVDTSGAIPAEQLDHLGLQPV